MEIRKWYLPEGIPADTKRNFKEGEPTTITVHYTGPLPQQRTDDVRHWWEKGGGEASAHYIIKNKECVQCWPETKVAWHAGCPAGNNTSIGIEVIPFDKEGVFSQTSIDTLKELIAHVRGIFKRDMPLRRHYDWSGKACPAYYVKDVRWLALLDMLGEVSPGTPV